MRKLIVIILMGLSMSFSEKYSVISLSLVSLQTPAQINQFLNAAAQRNFNTIAISVVPDVFESAANTSYLATDGYITNNAYRQAYIDAYTQILNHTFNGQPSNFNIMVRIFTGAEFMGNVDINRQIPWENNNFFLRNSNTNQIAVDNDPTDNGQGGSTWNDEIDFYEFGTNPPRRRRMLNFNDPYVMDIVESVWEEVIRDVVDVSVTLNAENRVISFTW